MTQELEITHWSETRLAVTGRLENWPALLDRLRPMGGLLEFSTYDAFTISFPAKHRAAVVRLVEGW